MLSWLENSIEFLEVEMIYYMIDACTRLINHHFFLVWIKRYEWAILRYSYNNIGFVRDCCCLSRLIVANCYHCVFNLCCLHV